MTPPDAPLVYRIAHPATGQPTLARRRGDRWFALSHSLPQLHRYLRQHSTLPDGTPIGIEGPDGPSLLAPCQPSKIICVGLKYQHHADEMNKAVPDEPLLFMKPPTSVISTGEAIVLPPASQEVHHEGELAIVIGTRLDACDEASATEAIVGYSCACDVTARDIQRREQRYTRAKGYRTFAPLGPAIAVAPHFKPQDHRLRCHVDGELRQQSSLDDFIFPIPRVLAFISQIMPLMPGDVVLTGTPAGVGPIEDGQRVTVSIEGIGTLENPVVSGV